MMARSLRRNLLITCGGKWVGMVLQLRQAMARSGHFAGGPVVVSSSAELTPAGCVADKAVVVPPILHPGYVEELLSICTREDIGLVVPLIDLDVERLAPYRAMFASNGTTVACPEPPVVELCTDKFAFSQFASTQGLAHPPTALHDNVGALRFPVFYKRRRGFGSLGAGVCKSLDDVHALGRQAQEMIFQCVVTASEITVDAYVSRDGDCRVCVPRRRDKVVAGESFKTHTIDHPPALDLARRTIVALADRGMRGPLNVQLFDTPEPCLIEVNTRLGSASVLSNVATGGAYFDLLLAEAVGATTPIAVPPYTVNLSLSRFLGDVFHSNNDVVDVCPGNAR